MFVEMKILKNLLSALIFTILTTISVSAQNQDDKKPKKDPPPVIKPGDKGDKGEKKDKPKKPQAESALVARLVEIDLD